MKNRTLFIKHLIPLNTWRHSLEDAIQMASTNPLKMFDLDKLGEIRQGKQLGLILFTIEQDEIVIQKTIVAGKMVYSKN